MIVIDGAGIEYLSGLIVMEKSHTVHCSRNKKTTILSSYFIFFLNVMIHFLLTILSKTIFILIINVLLKLGTQCYK